MQLILQLLQKKLRRAKGNPFGLVAHHTSIENFEKGKIGQAQRLKF